MNKSSAEETKYRKIQDEHEFQTSIYQNLEISTEIWDDDVLDRKKLADTLTRLVGNQKQPFVLCLDGCWGAGKTFLLKRWQKSLEREKFLGMYYNAWEDDFSDDPFLSLIGQIAESFDTNEDYSNQVDKICRTAAEVLNQFAEKVAGFNMKEIVKASKDKQIEDYKAQRKRKKELKSLLSELGSAVREKTGKPLVFIIDELDRCRPNFSIELLERVKHIFDVSNIVFVIGADKTQLSHSINSVYGEIDVDTYFRRFFDLTLKLPKPNTQEFCEHLLGQYKLIEFFQQTSTVSNSSVQSEVEDLFDGEFFSLLCLRLSLSLRDIEHALRCIAYIGKTIPPRVNFYPQLLGILVLIRLKNSNLYTEYMRREKNSPDIMNFIYKYISPRDFQSCSGLVVWRTVILC